MKFGCEMPGCQKNPSKGDTVYRTSPKGTPWRGRCRDHIDLRFPVDPMVNEVADIIERGW